MYEYRKLTLAQRRELLAHRRDRGFPLHAPPHFADGRQTYIITAACYEHRPILATPQRRTDFETSLVQRLPAETGAALHAWVVLPNHYHLLATLDLARFSEWARRFHSRCATRWNGQDGCRGRKVWFRYQDRQIRSDRHYFATLNYLHTNPVKHGHVARATDWRWSSLHRYLDEHGRDVMVQLWRDYPVDEYGKGWDD